MLHEHIDLSLQSLYLALRQLHELIILEQLLRHIDPEHARQVPHIVLLYLTVRLFVLGLHLVAFCDQLVGVHLLFLHQLDSERFFALLSLSDAFLTLVFELLRSTVLFFHLTDHRRDIVFQLLHTSHVFIDAIAASLVTRILRALQARFESFDALEQTPH